MPGIIVRSFNKQQNTGQSVCIFQYHRPLWISAKFGIGGAYTTFLGQFQFVVLGLHEMKV
jgi:hypothetical protein